MRMVSWIVVAGSLAWLLYGQLRVHFTDQELAGVLPDAVRGTIKAGHPAARGPGAETHVIAYADLYPQLVAAASVKNEIEPVPARVQSTLSDVEPVEIRLTLDDGVQTHHFPVDRRGRLHLPVRTDWRDEERQIVSNQPAGTLAVEVVGSGRFSGDMAPLPRLATYPEP